MCRGPATEDELMEAKRQWYADLRPDQKHIADLGTQLANSEAARQRLNADVERLRVQLAGCSTAAGGWGGDCAPDQYGWSPAYQDVIELRKKYEAAEAALKARREQ